MPPKAKITKEMIIDAAFAVTQAQGAENVNARTVAQKLGCSTQPVMYHFATIEDLKQAVYEKAGWFHTEYLLRVDPEEDEMLGIGLNYVRFAVEEPHLFRFLFQSGFAKESNLLEMVDSQEVKPILSAMKDAMGLSCAQTRDIFITLAMFVHGYASILVNNALEYDKAWLAARLKQVYNGAILAIHPEHELGGSK